MFGKGDTVAVLAVLRWRSAAVVQEIQRVEELARGTTVYCTVNTMRPAVSPLTKAAQVERDSGFYQQRAELEELTDVLEAAVAPSGPARRAPESRD